MKRSSEKIQKAVLFALMMRELQTRFGGQMIGLVWVLIEPLANILVLIAIRVVLRERYAGVQIDPALYLLVAMIPFFAMRNIWFRAVGSAVGNLGLFSYRQVKPLDAILARTFIETLLYIPVFLIALMGIYWWEEPELMPAKPLEYLGVVLLMLVWGLGMGLVTTVAAHRRPAVEMVVRLSFTPLYIMSGVLIPVSRFPPSMHEYLLWNPLLHLVELSRATYFSSYQMFNGTGVSYPFWTGISLFATGLLMLHLYRRRLVSR